VEGSLWRMSRIEQPQAARETSQLASAQVIESDPYAIACGHVRDQQKWADATQRATVALSNSAWIRGLNQLQATQASSSPMTELCKGRPGSYDPAKATVRAVRQASIARTSARHRKDSR
jgi:hypothetical protein